MAQRGLHGACVCFAPHFLLLLLLLEPQRAARGPQEGPRKAAASQALTPATFAPPTAWVGQMSWVAPGSGLGASGGPQRAPGGPQKTPFSITRLQGVDCRGSEEGPGGAQRAPGGPQRAPEGPRGPQRDPRKAPGVPQEGPLLFEIVCFCFLFEYSARDLMLDPQMLNLWGFFF